jgi:hypothetical protein
MRALARTSLSILGGVKPLVRRLREDLEAQADHYTRVMERRLVILAMRGFTVMLAIAFIGFGLLFTLMDIGGASRGVACLDCGLAGLVFTFLRVRFTEEKGRAA